MAISFRSMPLHTRILLGLLIGAAAGVVASLVWGPESAPLAWTIRHITQPLGDLWLRLLLLIVVPLVFSALVLGVAGVGDVRKLGRVGLKTLLYTVAISAISVAIGLALVNVIEPGNRISDATAAGLEERFGSTAEERVSDVQENAAADEIPVLRQIVQTLVPTNPFASIAAPAPNLLHIMFFALLLGVAATMSNVQKVAPFLGFLEGLFEISVRVVDMVMALAPYAVALLIFSSIASFGLDLLAALLWFVLTVLAGLLIHGLGVYSLSVYLLSALSPVDFFRRIRIVAVTAFSTSSSNATLPTALRESEEKLGVAPEINSFVLTVGATANQNGTALYEGVTILFLAQLAGVDLSLGAQLAVAYLAILGGIGTAGVPGGSIPYVILVLASLNIDPALIAVVLGIDRFLDMCRTTVNVVGDLTAATWVARSEGYPLNGQLRPPPGGTKSHSALFNRG